MGKSNTIPWQRGSIWSSHEGNSKVWRKGTTFLFGLRITFFPPLWPMLMIRAALQVLAYKTIRFARDPRGKAAVEFEYTVLSRLQHPNVLRYEAIQWLPKEARLYMEYRDGTNLEDYMWANSRFVSVQVRCDYNWRLWSESDWPSEQDVWRLFFQLAAALASCHSEILRKSTGGSTLTSIQDCGIQFYTAISNPRMVRLIIADFDKPDVSVNLLTAGWIWGSYGKARWFRPRRDSFSGQCPTVLRGYQSIYSARTSSLIPTSIGLI